MSGLYVYDFPDGQYIVDDSGERWEPVVFNQPDVKPDSSAVGGPTTVQCESCFDEVTEALENEHGTILCWNCHDVETVDLADYQGTFMDYGMGQWDMLMAVNIQERLEDGEVIISELICRNAEEPPDRSRWSEVMIGGVVYGYAFQGEVEDAEVEEVVVIKLPQAPPTDIGGNRL